MEDKNVVGEVVRKIDEAEQFAPETKPGVLREYPSVAPRPAPQPVPQPVPVAQQIRFFINKDKTGLTWEEYETIELAQEGEVKMRRLRPLVARFMVDENNQPIPHKQALDILGKLPMDEVKDVFAKFAEAMTYTAVPKATGTPSNLPSEAPTQTSASLTGS